MSTRSTSLVLAVAVSTLAACGARSDSAGSLLRASTPPAAAVVEEPTGDPELKNGAASLGKAPPEVHASDWVNVTAPPMLRDLSGRPVLVSFCELQNEACGEARAVLRDLHDLHARWGFTVIELFVDRPPRHGGAQAFFMNLRQQITALSLPWPAGFGDRVTHTQLRYAFNEVPAAYLLDADGRLIWSGNPKVHEASLRAAAETISGRGPH